MSNQKQLKEEIHRLNQQLRRLEEEKQAQQHESKKLLIEANAKLDFQTRKAEEYEQKYKSTLRYKNQEESVKQLDLKLTQKQNQLIRLMRLDHQKSQEIQELLEETVQLKNQNANLSNDLNQIKEAALNAIVDKDTTISQLTEKLEELQSSENLHQLRILVAELQERNHQVQEKLQNNKNQYLSVLEGRDEEINELQEKLSVLKEKHDQRITRFEQEILDYEKHIEQMNAERDHEANFEEKYYYTQEKLRKVEKRLVDLEQRSIQEKNQLLISIQKLETQNEHSKTLSEQLKQAKKKIVSFEGTTNNLKAQLDQYKQKVEKISLDHNRKEKQFESQKKILTDNLTIKIQEIQRLRAELDEKNQNKQPTLTKQKSSSSLVSPVKSISEDQSGLIQKLKKQNKDLQEANELLKRKIEEQTKQLQESRQKLLQARGSESNLEASKLMVQIQDLTSYLKKVENDMLMKKITHAEDENFWSIKQKKYKKQIEDLNKKYKKENSELLERIDRMKRLIPKDKKTDYYQSGFK